ncbi:hypothetical protein CARUB_v10012715mg [Capsella rubella]|uniref:PPPDE domain-containing protein n=1 Tax=Capsella rubella TaxID=81985 RepID=R0ESJ6_9BRAS|nr:hypothetical protein CARUB_v10012715mg [Capsella rubella]
MAEVVLHIYDVTNSGSEKTNNTIVQINRFFKDGIGLGGIFHSAIQVYGDDEWSYGYCEQGTGVFSCPSGKNSMYTYREKIVLGKTDCTIFMVNQMLRELRREWPGHTYDLLSKNCNHFCDILCDRLGVPKIPGWVNRFANAGDTALEVAGNTAMRMKQAKTELVSASKDFRKEGKDFRSYVEGTALESMTSIGSVEVKATINTGFPWKVVAKGSRSSTRLTKKQVSRAAAPDTEPEYKISAGTSAQGDSESEKLGVSVIGQHFADRVEHVPIKKRRFMVPPPSPLKKSTPCGEGSHHHAEINHILPVSRLNPNLLRQKTAEIPDDKPDSSSHDFSAIKILAEVACSNGMSSDIASLVDGQLVEPVKHDDALTLSAHVEGNDSSSGTDDVSGNDTTIESSDKVGEDKTKIIVSQKLLIDTLGNASAADQSEERIVASSGTIVAQNINVSISNESSTELPKETMEAGNSVSLAPQSESATVSEILSDDERTGKGKSTECLTDDRLHWDLNLPTDAWDQPCDVVVDKATRRYSDGEVTVSVTESGHVDGSKDYAAGLIESDVHMNSPSPSGAKAEASARNGKECQSGYDSQFEDGELREPYPWEEKEGDSGDVEQVDYGSEPENERVYSLAETNENKLEDVEQRFLPETKCDSGNVREGSSDVEKHVVVCMNDSHSKGSSPSRSFGSKPYKGLPSHESIPRRRQVNHDEPIFPFHSLVYPCNRSFAKIVVSLVSGLIVMKSRVIGTLVPINLLEETDQRCVCEAGVPREDNLAAGIPSVAFPHLFTEVVHMALDIRVLKPLRRTEV